MNGAAMIYARFVFGKTMVRTTTMRMKYVVDRTII